MDKVAVKVARKPDFEIDEWFYLRWSPRAFTGEAIPDEVFNKIFEAARWAPSSYNEQPWRILYAKRETPQWNTFFSLLVEGNQTWAVNASFLAVILSKKTFARNGNPNKVHIFDSGAAWENIALQAAHLDWAAHGMVGFDYERAAAELNVPDDFEVNAMFAVGKPGDASILPEKLRGMETPSGRKKIAEFVTEGKFQ